MARAVIGVTPSYEPNRQRYQLDEGYLAAVEEAGGVPLIIPYSRDADGSLELLTLCQGLILSGGGDINPLLFAEEPVPGLGVVCPRRDAAELTLTQRALEWGLPTLGICRGMQVLQVATGGSLMQDIAQDIPHCLQHRQQAPGYHASHRLRLEPGSLLARLAGGLELRVNSFHHQAVKTPMPPFRATAWAADGVVEAIEGPGFTLGVQWHPERMWQADGVALALFVALIKAAEVRCNAPTPLS